MLTRRLFLTTTLAAPLAASLPAQAGLVAVGPPGFDLLDAADLARREPLGGMRALRAVRGDGPLIRVAAPRSDRVASPVDFDISFLPKNGAAPVLATLKVEYNLGPFWKDVTRRILAAARVEGFRLRATGARLPEGRHVLRVRIRDEAGGETVMQIDLTVV